MSAQKLVVVIMLVSLMLQCGLEVNRAHLSAVLKDYALLGKAFLANFILVPLAAVILVRIFHLDEYIAIGVLLMAIAPGVPFLARAAGKKIGGSLGFALALSFIMPALSIITVPITARLVFPPGDVNRIPLSSLVVTLVIFQLIPMIIGMLIADRAPAVAEKLLRPLALVVAVCILGVLILVAPEIAKAVASVYGSYGLITALLLVVFSAAAGWLLGGPDVSHRNTLAMGTLLRNIGLASVIASVNFERTPVEAMVLSYFIIGIVVSAILSRILARRSKTPEAAVPA
jgi:bile acid:Na+ symporter, BASS family